MEYAFYTADVFTNRIFEGAQIAVFPHAEGLDERVMQRIADEMNLSETVFVLNTDEGPDKRRMKIFSPTCEIDFAGHPIIATAFVLAWIGDIPLQGKHTAVHLQQNNAVIIANISQKDGKPSFIQFALKPESIIDRFVPREHEIAEFLSLSIGAIEAKQSHPMLVSCGYPYLVVPLTSYEAVRKARFDYSLWARSAAPAMSAQEILLFSNRTLDPLSDFHGRLVGPNIGVKEDPPIGSAIPAFTSYLCAQQYIRPGTYAFAIDRGTAEYRRSLLQIEMDNKGHNQLAIRVGGEAVLVSKGTLDVPITH